MAKFGGRQEGAGRPKGSLSKIGRELREAIHEALQEAGGKAYLVGLSKTNPQVFCMLVSKVIPAEIELTHNNALDDMTTDDLVRLATAIGAKLERDQGVDPEGDSMPETGSVQAVH